MDSHASSISIFLLAMMHACIHTSRTRIHIHVDDLAKQVTAAVKTHNALLLVCAYGMYSCSFGQLSALYLGALTVRLITAAVRQTTSMNCDRSNLATQRNRACVPERENSEQKLGRWR